MSERVKGLQDELTLSPGFRNLVDAHADRTDLSPEEILERALALYDKHSPLVPHPIPPGETEAVELKMNKGALQGVDTMAAETGLTPDDIITRGAQLAVSIYGGLQPGEEIFIGDRDGKTVREVPTSSIPRRKA